VQSAANSNVAVAAAVARHLPAPLAARLLRAAQDAYVLGMSDVLVVTAGMLLVGAVLMAIFMPAHAPASSAAREIETIRNATVAS
jgi:hypothetical protein